MTAGLRNTNWFRAGKFVLRWTSRQKAFYDRSGKETSDFNLSHLQTPGIRYSKGITGPKPPAQGENADQPPGSGAPEALLNAGALTSSSDMKITKVFDSKIPTSANLHGAFALHI